MKKYTFYWLDGKREVLEGSSPENALTLTGYGGGAVRALDFYANGDDSEYEYVNHHIGWKRTQESFDKLHKTS